MNQQAAFQALKVPRLELGNGVVPFDELLQPNGASIPKGPTRGQARVLVLAHHSSWLQSCPPECRP